MKIDPFYISELLWEANARELTAEEFAYLKRWFDQDPVAHERLIRQLNDPDWIRENYALFVKIDPAKSFEEFKKRLLYRQSDGK